MAEIFFIASDERALDLIESLRIRSPKSLTFETDLPSAIKRLPKEHPRYVFIQCGLDGMPGAEIATHVKPLVGERSVELVLLTTEDSPGSPPAGFACSFSLTLPATRLSSEVMQLLTTEVASGPLRKDPSSLSDLSDLDLPVFALSDPADFEIPDFDDQAFEPHLAPLWPETSQQRPAFVPAGAEKIASPERRAPTFAADKSAGRTNEPEEPDEIVFFVPEPAPVEPAQVAPPQPQKVQQPQDFQEIEPPAATPAAPPAQKPSAAAKGPAPRKSLYPTPEQIYRKPPQLCGDDLDGEAGGAASPDEIIGKSRALRAVIIAAMLLLVLALGALLWQRFATGPEKAVQTVQKSGENAAPLPLASQVAVVPQAPVATDASVQLPGFVPKVAADSSYAAAHPGWELYQGDSLQFRLFREKGKIKAIQVLPTGEADIAEDLLPDYFKQWTGADLPPAGKVAKEPGISIETRKAQNGGEIAIYRSEANRRIVGLVLQLP